jgi:hypothetical protein
LPIPCFSGSYSFSPYRGKIDLVVIDGGHCADCVSRTRRTRCAWWRGGVVVRDDYKEGWPGVIQSVDAVARRRVRSLVRLHRTGIAVYDATGRARHHRQLAG